MHMKHVLGTEPAPTARSRTSEVAEPLYMQKAAHRGGRSAKQGRDKKAGSALDAECAERLAIDPPGDPQMMPVLIAPQCCTSLRSHSAVNHEVSAVRIERCLHVFNVLPGRHGLRHRRWGRWRLRRSRRGGWRRGSGGSLRCAGRAPSKAGRDRRSRDEPKERFHHQGYPRRVVARCARISARRFNRPHASRR
jgi:hypothetical protein